MPFDIALVRVDNRLVHGQILEAWIPYTEATCIIIADDNLAGDFFRETVIRMALPRNIELFIYSIEDFAKRNPYQREKGEKAIVLFGNIQDALKAYQLGFQYESLNIGNVHSENCAVCCSPSVFLSEEDIAELSMMAKDLGVRIDIRRVPKEKSGDIREVLKKHPL
ncbi:MAG: PTS sugar transporter subunit IIB [Syntrophaceae bacterium]|nr:PTS sugar transporter subunit IIB [Syntrophaceae bacterium]